MRTEFGVKSLQDVGLADGATLVYFTCWRSLHWLQLHWSDCIKLLDHLVHWYNTVYNDCGNQIQLSVFSMKILTGNHREIPANTPFYKHKYFACVNTHWSCSSPLFLHLDQNISCFLVFLRAVQRPELDCWNRGN